MRTIAILCVFLLTNTLMAQDANTLLPATFTSGPAIEEGAFRLKYEEAQAQVEVQKRLIAELREIVKELEAKNVCVCGEGCQCDAGGTACPCGLRGKAKAVRPVAKLVMVSMPGCPSCEQWWATERQRYQASGWAVERVSEQPKPLTLYPYWRLCIGDSCQTIPFCPFSQLDGRVQRVLDQ